jgi:hypothetical protein
VHQRLHDFGSAEQPRVEIGKLDGMGRFPAEGEVGCNDDGEGGADLDADSVIEIEAARELVLKHLAPSAVGRCSATRPLAMRPQTLVAGVDAGSYDDPLLLPIYHYQLETFIGRKGVGREEACI